MPGPTLTAGEEAAIAAAVAAIAAAQAARERPVQVLRDDGAAIIALGVPAAIVAAAGPAGFSFEVSEYSGPDGDGWALEVELRRDGQRWAMAHNEGPEPQRSVPWMLVPEGIL